MVTGQTGRITVSKRNARPRDSSPLSEVGLLSGPRLRILGNVTHLYIPCFELTVVLGEWELSFLLEDLCFINRYGSCRDWLPACDVIATNRSRGLALFNSLPEGGWRESFWAVLLRLSLPPPSLACVMTVYSKIAILGHIGIQVWQKTHLSLRLVCLCYVYTVFAE